jgi:dehydrogenase/reductase SDR family member 1
MDAALLEATALALGCNVRRGRPRLLRRRRARCRDDGRAAEWSDRQYFVNISFWAAQKYIGNVAYGVSKAATDKLTADMARELREHSVAAVSLYPGLVRTEKVLEAAAFLDLSNSESPQFIGRAVVALASDPNIMRRTGQVLVAASLAQEYNFADIDGKQPRPLTLEDV